MKNLIQSLFRPALAILFLISGNADAYSQLPDGTEVPEAYYSLLLANVDKEYKIEFDSTKMGNTSIINVYVHVVNNVQGNTDGIMQANISSLLNEASAYFKPIGTKFNLAGYEVVNEYEYGDSVLEADNIELLKKYYVENSLNIFLVQSILSNNTNAFGFTYFPSDSVNNAIYLRKDHATIKPLLTLLGHYFGLLSTYDDGAGLELVDRSNCKTTGDLICDTQADPGISGQVNDRCEYTGFQVDPNTKYYVPSVANLMTNSPFECRCIFTPQQLRRMYYYHLNYRSYLR